MYAADGKTLITKFYEEYRKPSRSTTDLAVHAAGDRGHRGRPVLRAQRRRRQGHRPRVRRQPAGRRRLAGRVDADHAVRADGAARLARRPRRRCSRPPSRPPPASCARCGWPSSWRSSSTKQRDPRALPQRRRTSATGRTASSPPPRSSSPSRPNELTLAEAAMLAGLVKAPSAYDPASQRPDAPPPTGATTSSTGWSRSAAITAGRGRDAPRREPIKLRLTDPPNDCVSVAAQHNDWGFFCDCFKNWWLEQPAFGADPAGAARTTCAAAATGRHHARPEDRRRRACAQVLDKETIGSAFALGVVVGRARHRPGQGDGGQPASTRWTRSDNGQHTDPRQARRRSRGNYPNTVNPLLGGGDLPGYQAGSTFKMFTMLAALDAGHAAVHRDPRPARGTSPSTSTAPGTARPACDGRLVPAERQRRR